MKNILIILGVIIVIGTAALFLIPGEEMHEEGAVEMHGEDDHEHFEGDGHDHDDEGIKSEEGMMDGDATPVVE